MTAAVAVCAGCCVLTALAPVGVYLAESDRDAERIAWAACLPGVVSFVVGLVAA